MPTNKRSGGRVTPKGSEPRPRPSSTPRKTRIAPEARSVRASADGGRYTAPPPKARFRPQWHRIAGWFGVLVGVLIAVLNDAMYFGAAHLLPFGHQELYLVLALVVGGSSTWFLGLFDREPTIYM